MRAPWPAKDPEESLVAAFDFTPDMDTGEAISSAVCSISVLSGIDADADSVLFVPSTIDDGVVLQPFRGGVSGVTYTLRCVATLTPTGRVLVLAANLPVRTA